LLIGKSKCNGYNLFGFSIDYFLDFPMSGVLDMRSSPDEGSVVNRENVMSLHNVDSLVTQTGANIGDGRVTAIAQELLNFDHEAQVWQDAPTLALMLSSVVKWLILILVWLGALAVFAPAPSLPSAAQAGTAQAVQAAPVADKHTKGKKKSRAGKAATDEQNAASTAAAVQAAAPAQHDDIWYKVAKWAGILVIAYQVYGHCAWALRLKTTRYKMSSQRLTIVSGVFSKTTNTYELHQLNSSGQIHSPFLLRLFGRANLYVGVWLSGIRNAEAVRDLVRNAGQIEASRVDKARWR
jgi:hypothetical protein